LTAYAGVCAFSFFSVSFRRFCSPSFNIWRKQRVTQPSPPHSPRPFPFSLFPHPPFLSSVTFLLHPTLSPSPPPLVPHLPPQPFPPPTALNLSFLLFSLFSTFPKSLSPVSFPFRFPYFSLYFLSLFCLKPPTPLPLRGGYLSFRTMESFRFMRSSHVLRASETAVCAAAAGYIMNFRAFSLIASQSRPFEPGRFVPFLYDAIE